jgi:GMP synthase-like glutamine amidotransferase
MDDSS